MRRNIIIFGSKIDSWRSFFEVKFWINFLIDLLSIFGSFLGAFFDQKVHFWTSKTDWKTSLKKGCEKYVKSRPKGVAIIIEGANVRAQGPTVELLAKANSDTVMSLLAN